MDSEFLMTNATRFSASAGWLNTQHDQRATMMAAIVRIRTPPCCNQKSLSPSRTITINFRNVMKFTIGRHPFPDARGRGAGVLCSNVQSVTVRPGCSHRDRPFLMAGAHLASD